MKKISTQKERILYFIEYKGLSKNKFYIETGISNGVLDKLSGLSMETVEKIYSTYQDINLEWLVTGKGSMLKQKSGSEKPEPPPPDHHYLIDLVEYQKKHIASLEKEVSQLKKEYTTGETLRMVSEPIEQLKK